MKLLLHWHLHFLIFNQQHKIDLYLNFYSKTFIFKQNPRKQNDFLYCFINNIRRIQMNITLELCGFSMILQSIILPMNTV